MENLKEVKETLGLLDSAYNQYYETGESISPELIDEAREILRELVNAKLYTVVVVKEEFAPNRYHYSLQLFGREISQCSGARLFKYAIDEAVQVINETRNRLGMIDVRESQLEFVEITPEELAETGEVFISQWHYRGKGMMPERERILTGLNS